MRILTHHLHTLFEFTAKAIYDNKLLECYFTRSFYKHILGIEVNTQDMENEDYEFYKGLVYLMENHVSALGYDQTFSLEVQEFGVTEVRDLIPNGRNIVVTEENKFSYIHLVCQLKMSGSIKQQYVQFQCQMLLIVCMISKTTGLTWNNPHFFVV